MDKRLYEWFISAQSFDFNNLDGTPDVIVGGK